MKLEREVIIDLLPAYFSGEASAATRTLVENFFRENPDFEKSARSAAGPLESLKAAPSRLGAGPDPEKEKLALERARLVVETRNSFLGLALFFTFMLLLFRFNNHKIVWVFWSGSASLGIVFSALAAFMWLLYLYTRRRKDPLQSHTKFLWLACFYSFLPCLFTVRNHKLVWLYQKDPDVAFIFGSLALGLWVLYFFQRRKKRKDL
jgi:hypothetical protein